MQAMGFIHASQFRFGYQSLQQKIGQGLDQSLRVSLSGYLRNLTFQLENELHSTVAPVSPHGPSFLKDRIVRLTSDFRDDPAFVLRTPSAPAPNPDADIDTTTPLRSVNYMLNHICEPISPNSVRILSLSSPGARWGQKAAYDPRWHRRVDGLKPPSPPADSLQAGLPT